MKNKAFILLALCLAEVVSCVKESPLREGAASPDGLVRFLAGAEQTRTSLSDDGQTRTVVWEKDDSIRIFYGETSVTAAAESAGATTTFKAVVPVDSALYAAYPHYAATFSDGVFTLSVPSVQDGKFAGGNLSLSRLATDGMASTFYNATAFLSIAVTDPAWKKVTVSAVGGESLCGKMTCVLDDDGRPVPGDIEEGGSSVVLSLDGPGTYYLSILPGVRCASGISAKFEDASGACKHIWINRDICIPRSCMATLADVDGMLDTVCVSVGGAGDRSGNGWANAMDKTTFVKLVMRISGDSDPRSAVQASMLRGKTFLFASGAYDFGQALVFGFNGSVSENVSFTIEGGYTGGVKSDLSPTVFSGGGAHTILCLDRYASLTVRDCRFYNSRGSGDSQAAVRVASPLAGLELSGCSFIENTNTGTAGALRVDSGAAVKMSDCTFSTNAAFEGGAVQINGGMLECTSCRFIGNSTNGSAGTCSFGGAVMAGCNGPEGAAVTSSVRLDRCWFEGNHALRGGAVCLGDKGAEVYMNACCFKGDYTTDIMGGTTIYVWAGKALCINNTTILDGTCARSQSSALSWKRGANGAWIFLESSVCQMVLSNNTFVGRVRDDAFPDGWNGLDGYPALIHVADNTLTTHCSVNNIIAPSDADHRCCSLLFESACRVTSYYTKRAMYKFHSSAGDLSDTWSSSGTDGYGNAASGGNSVDDGVLGDSSFFGGMSLVSGGSSPAENFWKWNGTMSNFLNGSRNSKALLSEVKSHIKTASSPFHSWLDGLGALSKDQCGNTRGSSTWPGAYQGQSAQ